MTNTFHLKNQLFKQVSIAPLIMFRIIFGALMLYSTIRFIAKGWIHTHLIAPKIHFTYYGFSWVKPLPDAILYMVFVVMLISCFCIMIGLLYRIATILFFLTFTYTELIDITYYLNHYYFVSLVSFLMIFVPANKFFSLDVIMRRKIIQTSVSAWTINIFKIQLAIVYIYAGLAKINYDWLILAQPLSIWLPAKSNLFGIGFLLNYKIIAFLFSWAGMLFDTFIVVFLLWKKTRPYAYIVVIFFHTMTAHLFQIGVFPLVMTFSVLIFFSAAFHERVLFLFGGKFKGVSMSNSIALTKVKRRILTAFLFLFFAFQFIFPWRYLLYPGNLFWTEEGYRFSWRVMLIEKAGTATFYVHDAITGKKGVVPNSKFLNQEQEKQMSMQPDLILQYAHFLKNYYKKQGVTNPKVTAEVYVTLNARPSKLYIDPNVDLSTLKDGWLHKTWILPDK